MESRDLFLGLILIVGAGYIAVMTPLATSPAFLVAAIGCALAGLTYLSTDVLLGRLVAGRPLTPLRIRALAQGFIGISLVALGLDGLLTQGDFFSALIAGVGVLVLGLARILWTRDGATDSAA